MQQFAAAQHRSTVKLPRICLKFQTKEPIVSVNKSEITDENGFHEDIFEIEDNHESRKDEKA